MPPLSDEFKRHLHSLMMEAADKVRDENARHKNDLVHNAIQTHNSAALPLAYSNAAIDAFRSRITTTIDSFLNALETCGIIVDGVVEREVLTDIRHLTAARPPLTFPPAVRSQNVSAVKQEHARRLERTGNELERNAKNRLRELKMKSSRTVPAIAPMMQSPPFTIASVAHTLAALKALPGQEQATLLLRRLACLYPQVKSTGGFNKHNILLPGDTTGIAYGFADNEKMRVLEHLLGVPWTRLVNDGFLVDLRDSKFFVLTDEGFTAAEEAAKPKQAVPQPSPIEPRKLMEFEHPDRPVAFMSYSWETTEHQDWVLALATRLVSEGGVNVVIDKWHLRFGMDKTVFMEDGIENSNFVLVICTPEYAAKANKRRGGVGYEAMIITGELAEDIQTTKFIPVLRVGAWDRTSMPRWLKTKAGPDLRGNPYNEGQFKLLVRELHGQYLKPPAPGPKPDFSFSPAPAPAAAAAPAVRPIQAGRLQNAISYAFYETKGPDAKFFKMYIRPLDAGLVIFRLDTSDGEVQEGILDDIVQDFILTDRKYIQNGYVCTHYSNFSGRKELDLH